MPSARVPPIRLFVEPARTWTPTRLLGTANEPVEVRLQRFRDAYALSPFVDEHGAAALVLILPGFDAERVSISEPALEKALFFLVREGRWSCFLEDAARPRGIPCQPPGINALLVVLVTTLPSRAHVIPPALSRIGVIQFTPVPGGMAACCARVRDR